MRRIALIVVAFLAVIVLVAAESDDDGGDYKVEGIFDNAAFLAEGEQVKIAGAGVGVVNGVELTDDLKAAATFTVTDSAFTPFHADAHCTIRSEGLLAVKFIECDPGTAESPELSADSGKHLLPVENTSTPVDLDLVLDSYGDPTGQQLALMLSELGAGLAGRGDELNEVIHRSAPAFEQTDRVFKILAAQNRQLAQFATDADAVATALASKQEELASFVTNAAGTAETTAEQSEAIAASIERLPGFLRELRPAARDLTHLTREGTPVLTQLGQSGTDLGRAIHELEPVANKGIPALHALGDLADTAGPDLQRTLPVIEAANKYADPLKGVAANLGELSLKLKKNQFRQRFLELLYTGASATNGFDEAGHYARVEVLSSACSEYTTRGFPTCDANWGGEREIVRPVASSASSSPSAATPAGGAAGALFDFLMGGGQ